MTDLSHRQRSEEWMDQPDADSAALARSLRFIRRINHWLGYTRATLGHLDRFSQSWNRIDTIRILDVATGSADVPRAILAWADRKRFNVEIVAIDLHSQTACIAQGQDAQVDPRLKIVRADALAMPFARGSFDYALSAMFLHHLSNESAAAVLREMNRVARRGIIAADLLRHRRALMWITLFTLWAEPMVKHDARVSVRQAFVREEVLELRASASIEYADYFRHFGHRFILAGEKPR